MYTCVSVCVLVKNIKLTAQQVTSYNNCGEKKKKKKGLIYVYETKQRSSLNLKLLLIFFFCVREKCGLFTTFYIFIFDPCDCISD